MTENKNFAPKLRNRGDELNVGLSIICFVAPIVGIVIYFTNKRNFPNRAKAAGILAIVGIAINLVFTLLIQANM